MIPICEYTTTTHTYHELHQIEHVYHIYNFNGHRLLMKVVYIEAIFWYRVLCDILLPTKLESCDIDKFKYD